MKDNNKTFSNMGKIEYHNIREKFIELVNAVGRDGEFQTFSICSDHGVELDESTIDKIKVVGDRVDFYFNECTDDYAPLECFTYNGLVNFLDGIVRFLIDDVCDGEALDIVTRIGKEIDEFACGVGTREYYDSFSNSDLFAIVCEECQKETILDMAEQFIDEDDVRNFLLACLGCNIE